MEELLKFYNSAQKEVFRLELLPIYKVSGEWEEFQNYLAGEERPKDDDFKSLCDNINSDILIGKSHIRVRVVPLILNEYIHFEIDWFYNHRYNSGEKIYFIEENKYKSCLINDFNPSDFYLFDNKYCFELVYNPSGEFLNVKRNESILNFISLKNILLTCSQNFLDYLQK